MLVPYPLNGLDPHDLFDPIPGLFGSAVFDPLFALDARGRLYPALAASHPEKFRGGVRVTLRKGLRSARGAELDAKDLLASLTRARRHGAAPLLDALGSPRAASGNHLAVDLIGAEPLAAAAALASPLLPLMPGHFSPALPDGTGAFEATFAGGALQLTKNSNAARGPAFLERIEVRTAADLASLLRAFENGSADLGWLGSGLHRPRRSVTAFRGTRYGWAILRTGKLAGAWDAPGVAQGLLDAVDPNRLRHLGIEALPRRPSTGARWGAGPADLLVLAGAPQLVAIAQSLAEMLAAAGHELRVTPRTPSELNRARSAEDYALMVDFVRSLGPDEASTQLALLTAQDPELARKRPQIEAFELRSITRQLRLGVIGELWISGAHGAELRDLAGWSLGDVWRVRQET